jgi:hypothetical protein
LSCWFLSFLFTSITTLFWGWSLYRWVMLYCTAWLTRICRSRGSQIEQNITKARRTAYSLLSTGSYGKNGLDPITSISLYKIYVQPVLMYGLEIVQPKQTNLKKLEVFQKSSWQKTICCSSSLRYILLYLWIFCFLVRFRSKYSKMYGFFNCRHVILIDLKCISGSNKYQTRLIANKGWTREDY